MNKLTTNPTSLRAAVERATARLDYDVGSKDRSQLITRNETIIKKDDLRTILAALNPDEEKVARAIRTEMRDQGVLWEDEPFDPNQLMMQTGACADLGAIARAVIDTLFGERSKQST
jgi:hypothetical protein